MQDVAIRLSLDVQVGNRPFYSEVLSRARCLQIGSSRVKVATIEDLLLLKLIAFRPIDRADRVHLLRLYPLTPAIRQRRSCSFNEEST